MLAIDHLHYYPNGHDLLRGVCLRASRGEVLGLVGANGSGKSSLFNLLSGEAWPDSGSALLEGKELLVMPPHKRARLGVCRSHQTPRVFERQRVLDNAAGAGPLAPALGWLERVGLAGLERRLAADLNLEERRMLELARIGVRRPKLVLLDEPAAGLSNAGISVLRECLSAWSAHGAICIVAEHRIEKLVLFASRSFLLCEGRLSDNNKSSYEPS